jgi:rubrerythrin
MKKTNKELLTEMMSKIPSTNNGENIDNQLLRIGVMSELDAINLYEQLAELATDDTVKAMFKDIAKEEKVHLAEFNTQLKESDDEVESTTKDGEDEEEQIEDEGMNEAKKRLYGKTATQQLNEMKSAFKRLIK